MDRVKPSRDVGCEERTKEIHDLSKWNERQGKAKKRFPKTASDIEETRNPILR